MTSKTMRDNPLFMRNNFKSVGKWGIPIIRKQELSNNDIMLVACSDTRANDNEENKKKGVHFLLIIIASMEFTIIPKEPLKDIHSMLFYFHPTFLPMQIWICGVNLKALQRIAGWVLIGKAKE